MTWQVDHGAAFRPIWPAVIVCCVAVVLLALPADASRDLPDTIGPTLDLPVVGPSDLDQTAPVRRALPFFSVADLGTSSAGRPHDYDDPSSRFCIYGGPGRISSSTRGEGFTHRHLSQGLWTDPVTGIAYARNRWYDARTASWLSEDPKEAVDSPNLYSFVAWQPHAATDPLGLEVTVTPKGNVVVTYKDGTIRTFSADRVAQNPAAVDAVVLESVGGDRAAADYDLRVGVLKWEHYQEFKSAPGDDEIIYQQSGAIGPEYAINGSGEIHSAYGDIKSDYSVEALALTLVTGGYAAAAVRAGGATVGQTTKAFVANVVDDVAGETIGINPSLVRTGIQKVGGRNPINWKYAGDVHPSGVRFKETGFPDFSPHTKAQVEIEGLTGNYAKDAAIANKAMGYPRTPEGYVWHHVEDTTTMQLLPRDPHNMVRHTGGAAVIKHGGN